MRIAMIGAGAMGAMFGARFARTGAEVVLYDIDADHIAAISANGLVVTDPDGEAIARLAATTSPVEVGPVDCAVIMVDANATEAVAVAIAPVLAPDAFILTLQNGIGNIEKLVAAFGKERVVAGCTYNSAARQEPGKVLHSNIGETTIGELDGSRSDRVAAIAGLFRECGLPIEVSDNVIGHIWMKFVLNAAINPVCAVTRLRPGEIVRRFQFHMPQRLAGSFQQSARIGQADALEEAQVHMSGMRNHVSVAFAVLVRAIAPPNALLS